MAALELAAINLGASLVKSACKVLVGDSVVAADASDTIVDVLKGRLTGKFDERRLDRFLDQCADIVATRCLAVIEQEFRGIPENDKAAAVIAVGDTFALANMSARVIAHADMDPWTLERYLRPVALQVRSRAGLGASGEAMFDFLLKESCAYLVQLATSLPELDSAGIAELLVRQTAVLDTLQTVLSRLPARRGIDDLATDYRRQVARKLDRMEIYGARLSRTNREYPLTVAYLTMTAFRAPIYDPPTDAPTLSDGDSATKDRVRSRWSRLALPRQDKIASRPTESESTELFPGLKRFLANFSTVAVPMTEVLRHANSILVVGEAGSGKTTLLRWLAVQGARRDFGADLEQWNHALPFFIRLREYAGRPLPRPEEFPTSVVPNILGELPPSWVHDLLRDGRASVLVDGIDELPVAQRRAVLSWLQDLMDQFPRSRYVITSRPAAVRDWRSAWPDLATVEVQPMSPGAVTDFVQRWHRAVAQDIHGDDERLELREHARKMLVALETDRHLRRLAVNPLMCALLCALNRELRSRLPRSRMEVYEAALSMLLDQRDRERGVELPGVNLTKSEKILLLQNLSLWLVRNGKSDASSEEVLRQLDLVLPSLRREQDVPNVEETFRLLLERSGVLREPAVDRVDFIHRTFEEYLAGKAAVEANAVGELVRNAGDDQWREVIILAAGHAQPVQCGELLERLIERSAGSAQVRLLTVACLQTARQINPVQRSYIEQLARTLMPPADMEVAQTLAGSGDYVLDLLPEPTTHFEAATTARVAVLIGGHDALLFLSRLIRSRPAGEPLIRELLSAQSMYSEQYFELVLAHIPENHVVSVPRGDLSLLRSLTNHSAFRLFVDAFRQGGPEPEVLSRLTYLDLVWPSGGHWGSAQDFSEEALDIAVRDARASKERFLDTQDFDTAAHEREQEVSILSLRRLVEVVAALADGLELQVLRLSEFPFSSLRDFPVLPTVRHLCLSEWGSLRELDALEHWTGLTHLQVLSAQGARRLSLRPLSALTALESLDLDLGDTAVIDLSDVLDLPSLGSVVVHHCLGLTAQAVGPRARMSLHLCPHQTLEATGDLSGIDIVRDVVCRPTHEGQGAAHR